MTACGTGILQRLVQRGAERQAVMQLAHEEKKRKKRAKLEEKLVALKRENTLLRRLSSEAVKPHPPPFAVYMCVFFLTLRIMFL